MSRRQIAACFKRRLVGRNIFGRLLNRNGTVAGQNHDQRRLESGGHLEVGKVGEEFAKLGEIVCRDGCCGKMLGLTDPCCKSRGDGYSRGSCGRAGCL